MRLDVLLDRHISSITWYLVLFLRKCVFGNLLFFVTTIETLEQSRGCSSQSQKVKGFFFFAFGKKKNKFLCYGLRTKSKQKSTRLLPSKSRHKRAGLGLVLSLSRF